MRKDTLPYATKKKFHLFRQRKELEKIEQQRQEKLRLKDLENKKEAEKSSLYTMEEIDTEEEVGKANFVSPEIHTDDDIEEEIDFDTNNNKTEKIEFSGSSDIPEVIEQDEEESDEEIPEIIVVEEN